MKKIKLIKNWRKRLKDGKKRIKRGKIWKTATTFAMQIGNKIFCKQNSSNSFFFHEFELVQWKETIWHFAEYHPV